MSQSRRRDWPRRFAAKMPIKRPRGRLAATSEPLRAFELGLAGLLAIDRQVAVIDLKRHAGHRRGVEAPAALRTMISLAKIPAPFVGTILGLGLDQIVAHLLVP